MIWDPPDLGSRRHLSSFLPTKAEERPESSLAVTMLMMSEVAALDEPSSASIVLVVELVTWLRT